jgi:hypothetical protein
MVKVQLACRPDVPRRLHLLELCIRKHREANELLKSREKRVLKCLPRPRAERAAALCKERAPLRVAANGTYSCGEMSRHLRRIVLHRYPISTGG